METPDKSIQPQQDEQKALQDIAAIRATKNQPDRNRVAEFDKRLEEKTPFPRKDQVIQIGIIDEKGMSVAQAHSYEEAAKLLAMANGWDMPTGQEPENAVSPNNLTDEQLEYITELEERAGVEFSTYDEAVEWERNEYGESDLSQDNQFDMER